MSKTASATAESEEPPFSTPAKRSSFRKESRYRGTDKDCSCDTDGKASDTSLFAAAASATAAARAALSGHLHQTARVVNVCLTRKWPSCYLRVSVVEMAFMEPVLSTFALRVNGVGVSNVCLT